MKDRELSEWLAVLDSLNHYEVLGIVLAATSDQIRGGFSQFAESFHPDGHLGRPRDEQDAVLKIYKRGTEAYRVLSDPKRREDYDAPRRQEIVHPPSVLAALKSLPRNSQPAPVAGRLIDRVKVAGAKPFVMKAMKMKEEGQLKKAKLELSMAMNMDRDNPELAMLMLEIESALKLAPKF